MKTRSIRRGTALLTVFMAITMNDRSVGAVPRAKNATRSTPVSKKRVVLAQAQSISQGFSVEASDSALADRGRAALRLLEFDPAQAFPGWTVAFLPRRDRLLGLTLVNERRVEIYVRTDRPIEGLAHDLAHEFGHVFDVSYNTNAVREKYLGLRGLEKDTQWWACDSCRDLEVGAGDFAEVFAHLVAPRFAFYSKVKPRPGQAVSDRIRTEILAPVLGVGAPDPGGVLSVSAEPTAAAPVTAAP